MAVEGAAAGDGLGGEVLGLADVTEDARVVDVVAAGLAAQDLQLSLWQKKVNMFSFVCRRVR